MPWYSCGSAQAIQLASIFRPPVHVHSYASRTSGICQNSLWKATFLGAVFAHLFLSCMYFSLLLKFCPWDFGKPSPWALSLHIRRCLPCMCRSSPKLCCGGGRVFFSSWVFLSWPANSLPILVLITKVRGQEHLRSWSLCQKGEHTVASQRYNFQSARLRKCRTSKLGAVSMTKTRGSTCHWGCELF